MTAESQTIPKVPREDVWQQRHLIENARAIEYAEARGLTVNPEWLRAPRTEFICHPMVVEEDLL